jgi:small subunit ribosomal protein S3
LFWKRWKETNLSVVKHFIEDSIKKKEIDEFLQNEFERAGYGGVSITKTPLGTHLVIYTMRPGLVIGRGGETIRALSTILEEKFQLPSPQISVAEIEVPELNAYVVASKIASALKRGVHYRRAGFWGITQAMEAGALGIEVIISGKLRTDRARYEKFREGYLPKSGEPPRKYMRKAELHVHLKPGTLGVRVSLLPPDAQFPDQVKVHVVEEDIEPTPQRKTLDEPSKVEPESPTQKQEKVDEAEIIETPSTEPETIPVTSENTKSIKKSAKLDVALEDKTVTEEKKDVNMTEIKEISTSETKVLPKTKEIEADKKDIIETSVSPVKEKPSEVKKIKTTTENATKEKEEAGE